MNELPKLLFQRLSLFGIMVELAKCKLSKKKKKGRLITFLKPWYLKLKILVFIEL
jgi:hypothetical protein